MRRGLTNTNRAPRAAARRIVPSTFGIEKKLACDARGFSPITRHRSVWSRSGIGWTVDVPKTASLATNLLAQSWVPDENVRRTPSARSNVETCNVARALNAVGLPM